MPRHRSRLLVDDALGDWMRHERKKLSSKAPAAKALDYTLKRWPAFKRFLDDGRICMTNNAAERAVRGIAVGRRNWTFCGSDSGGHRAALIYALIETAKLNGVDPRGWLADVLARIGRSSSRTSQRSRRSTRSSWPSLPAATWARLEFEPEKHSVHDYALAALGIDPDHMYPMKLAPLTLGDDPDYMPMVTANINLPAEVRARL